MSRPQLLASSLNLQNPDAGLEIPPLKSSVFFKSAQWSPDGTCIITNSSDNILRTFVVPHDLLDNELNSSSLMTFSKIKSAEPIDALSVYPFYDLQDTSTNLVLSAANEQPVRLTSSITGHLLASYPLIHPTTEAYIKPNALLFSRDGSHFTTGTDSCLSFFDVSRPGQAPVISLQTGPKKANAYTNPSTTMRGRISALSLDHQFNVLAAGTFSRHIGLYDSAGRGDCLGVFCVQGTEADDAINGTGVTQLLWSPCGRYLYIAERKSDGVMFYDIRKTGQLLGWLNGRDARTNQRMGIELAQNTRDASVEIWAGGIHGHVHVWKNPTLSEGSVSPTAEMSLHDESVNSVGMHHRGGVLATASGQRNFSEQQGGSSLRIWMI